MASTSKLIRNVPLNELASPLGSDRIKLVKEEHAGLGGTGSFEEISYLYKVEKSVKISKCVTGT